MTSETSAHADPEDLQRLQFEQARLQTEKLRMEVDALRRGRPWYRVPVDMVPMVTALLAVLGFWWGVVQYKDEQAKNREAQREQARRERAAADRAAAEIASATDPSKKQRATDEFWRLYQGEMIPVETKRVSGAMVEFGRCLDGSEACDREELNNRSRALGTAMALSMAETAKMTYDEYVANRFAYSTAQ